MRAGARPSRPPLAPFVDVVVACLALTGCVDAFTLESELAPTFFVAAIEADPWQVPEGETTHFRTLVVGVPDPIGVDYTWELCAFTEGADNAFHCATRDDGVTALLASGTSDDPSWENDIPPLDAYVYCMEQARYSRDPLALPVDCREGLPATLRVEATYGGRTAIGVKTIVIPYDDEVRHPTPADTLRFRELITANGPYVQDVQLGDAPYTIPLSSSVDWYTSYGTPNDDELVLSPDLRCGARGWVAAVNRGTTGRALRLTFAYTRLLPRGCEVEVEIYCDTNESSADEAGDSDGDGLNGCEDPDCAGSPECVEHLCGDEEDGDHDGLIDCEDPDCETYVLCTEHDCYDGIDNNRDGLTDCEDPDCVASGACHEGTCWDAWDNDRDGLTDCDDPDCIEEDALCGHTELGVYCTDGIDNDDNTLVDCQEASCLSTQPLCRAERDDACGDGFDNDVDGEVDCDDAGCARSVWCASPVCGDGDVSPETLVWSPRGHTDAFFAPLCAVASDGSHPTTADRQAIVEPWACPEGFTLLDTDWDRHGPAVALPLSCGLARCDAAPVLCGETLNWVRCTRDEVIETCDEGGDVNGTPLSACTADCQWGACGDGILSLGEGCDDGNRDDDDLCTSDCQRVHCGDGVLDDSEGCDDGNFVDGDGCTGCVLDVCGDGRVAPLVGEACDGGAFCTDACARVDVCAAGIVGTFTRPEAIAALNAEGLALTDAQVSELGYATLVIQQELVPSQLELLTTYVETGGTVVFAGDAVLSLDALEAFGVHGCGAWLSAPHAMVVARDDRIVDGPRGALTLGHLFETSDVPQRTCELEGGQPLITYTDGHVMLAELDVGDAPGHAYLWAEPTFSGRFDQHPELWVMTQNLVASTCE